MVNRDMYFCFNFIGLLGLNEICLRLFGKYLKYWLDFYFNCNIDVFWFKSFYLYNKKFLGSR